MTTMLQASAPYATMLFYKQWKASQIQFMRLIVIFFIPCSTQDSEDPVSISLFYSGFRGSRGSSFSIVPSEDAEEVSILLSSIPLSTNG